MKDYTIFATPEQEQARKERKQALENLTYNTMCYGCKALHKTCDGTKSKFYGGCIYREPNGLNVIYGLAQFVPERNKRTGVVEWLKSRIRGEHSKNEILTGDYIRACKKILEILKEG